MSQEILPSSHKARVAIIEDDRDLNNLLKFTLESTQNLQVHSHFEGLSALSFIREAQPDIVILDVMLPGTDGLEILRQLRQEPATAGVPVVLLTAKGQEADRVQGFLVGADDYITKPFSPKELVLRVQALLRRARPYASGASAQTQALDAALPSQNGDRVIEIGSLRVYPELYKVTVGEETVALTATEYQLLVYLAERLGRLQSREALLQKVWGYEGNMNTRTVDTHVKRLRQKLGPAGALIETVHGFGYQLVQAPGRVRHAVPAAPAASANAPQ